MGNSTSQERHPSQDSTSSQSSLVVDDASSNLSSEVQEQREHHKSQEIQSQGAQAQARATAHRINSVRSMMKVLSSESLDYQPTAQHFESSSVDFLKEDDEEDDDGDADGAENNGKKRISHLNQMDGDIGDDFQKLNVRETIEREQQLIEQQQQQQQQGNNVDTANGKPVSKMLSGEEIDFKYGVAKGKFIAERELFRTSDNANSILRTNSAYVD